LHQNVFKEELDPEGSAAEAFGSEEREMKSFID
jgi:hypothetical protein